MSDLSLKELMVPSRIVNIEYPGLEGLTIDICYLARESMNKLRTKCVSSKFNKKLRSFEDVLDEDKFLEVFVKETIKGWQGFKYKYVEEFLLVDISKVNPEDEMVFSQDNAVQMMKNSSSFDEWVMEVISDLENFTQTK